MKHYEEVIIIWEEFEKFEPKGDIQLKPGVVLMIQKPTDAILKANCILLDYYLAYVSDYCRVYFLSRTVNFVDFMSFVNSTKFLLCQNGIYAN